MLYTIPSTTVIISVDQEKNPRLSKVQWQCGCGVNVLSKHIACDGTLTCPVCKVSCKFRVS